MGLPSYLRHIAEKYPNCLLSRRGRGNEQQCHRLFVDFNGIIHNAAAACMQKSPKSECHDDDVISATLEAISDLVERVRPSSQVYISIDGFPPYSKMVQQRQRRFMSSWRQNQLPDGLRARWDTNAITPGTIFMDKLADRLHDLSRRRSTPECLWIVSDASEPGEGETKIFKRMREDTADIGTITVVHGADADLLIRGLLYCAFGGPYTYVMREQRAPNAPIFVDLERLRQYIRADMANGDAGLFDYVFLVQLVGNDFFPALSFLHHKPFAVPFLMHLYRNVIAKPDLRLWEPDVTDDDATTTIHWDNLLLLINEVASQEDARFPVGHDNFVAATPSHSMSPQERLDNLPLFHKYPGFDPRQPGWRRAYYKQLLRFNDPVEDRFRACAPYLQGMQWMLRYYVSNDAALGWRYPFTYSPTATDLAIFLQATLDCGQQAMYSVLTGADAAFPSTDPRFQLLLVLPPQSEHLLPPALRPLMHDPRLGCVAFFPWDFRVATYMKRYIWECAPLIPEPNVALMFHRFTERVTTTP